VPAALAWAADRLLAPALVAVLFAGTTTLLLEWYRGRRDAVSRLVDGLRGDLTAVQDLAIEYWSRKRLPDDPIIEARLIAAQTEIGFNLRLVHETIRIVDLVDVDDKIADVFDLLTGGSFQTRRRVADPVRVQRISAALAQLRHNIIRTRISRLGPIFPTLLKPIRR
jgi:hypothetical protein